MRSSWVILILIPFIISIGIIITLLNAFLKYGPRSNDVILLSILVIICGYLGWKIIKALTQKEAFLEIPGSEELPPKSQNILTQIYLISAFVVLAGMGIFLFNINTTKNWIGFGSFIMGVTMWFMGLTSLFSKLPSQSELTEEDFQRAVNGIENQCEIHRKWGAYITMSDIGIGVIFILLYKLTSLREYLSGFDIVGILIFLSGYATWFLLRGISLKRRLVELKKAGVK
jgi:hypothetical protein